MLLGAHNNYQCCWGHATIVNVIGGACTLADIVGVHKHYGCCWVIQPLSMLKGAYVPFSMLLGAQVGEAGLQERLVRTRAAMCSSITAASASPLSPTHPTSSSAPSPTLPASSTPGDALFRLRLSPRNAEIRVNTEKVTVGVKTEKFMVRVKTKKELREREINTFI